MAKKIQVSEHALLRYFQRVGGRNLHEARNAIIKEGLGGRGRVPDGQYEWIVDREKGDTRPSKFVLVVKNNRVITISHLKAGGSRGAA